MSNSEHTTDISRQILDTLSSKGVRQRPRWHFMLQEGAIWVLGGLTVFCGAVAVSASLFVIVTAPLRFGEVTHDTVTQFWLDFVPTIWIMLFVTFVFATDWAIKKTKRGYRYNIVYITIGSMLCSIILGYGGFMIGIGEYFENRVGSAVPFHTPVRLLSRDAWNHPDKGLLIGELSVGEKVTLETREGTVWTLDVTELPDSQRAVLLNNDEVVGLVGTSTAAGMFSVCAVIPFERDVFEPEYFSFERKPDAVRTNTCKGVRPYERLQAKLIYNENQ